MPVWGTGPKRTDGRSNNPISAPLTYILPNQIASLGLWLDSADLSTFVLSSISTVRIWRDKSQFGLNFSTQQGLPQFSTNAGVFFNITQTDLMISPSTFTTTAATTTIFAVGNLYAGGSMMIGFGDNADLSLRFGAGIPNINDIFFTQTIYFNGSVIPFEPSPPTNGNFITNGRVYPTQTSQLTLSSRFLGRYYNGTISEVLIFNTILDDTQRRGIEAYLARKWGIQSRLPFQHPGRPSQALAGYRLLNLSTILPAATPYTWFDAMDPGTFTDALGNTPAQNLTKITRWRDKSVNNLRLDVGGPVTLAPTFNLMGCNIYPELSGFVTSYTKMISPAAGAQTVSEANAYKGSSISLFYVLTVNGSSNPLHAFTSSFGQQTVISISTTTDIILSHDGTNIQFSRIGNGTQASNSVINAPLALSNKSLVSIFVNGERTTIGNVLPSTNLIEINGSFVSSSTRFAGNPFNLQYLALFTGWNFGAGNANVNFSEIIQYNRVLTTPERTALESQLLRKWQLPSNVPVTYINNLPVTDGLFGWYDAYDQTTVLRNASNNVSMWLDKSGQSNHMSTNLLTFGSNTGSNIYYSSISISTNQYPSLFFPSTFAFMQTSTLITNQNMSSITMMAVKRGIKIPATNQLRTVSVFSTVGALENVYIGATSSALYNTRVNNTQFVTNYSTFHINTLVGNVGVTTVNGVTPFSAVTYYNGLNAQITPGISLTGNNIYPSYIRLMTGGVDKDATTTDAGYLAEVLLFNRILSSTELTNTHNYLLNKWGISNIISNVPVTSGLNLWLDAYDPSCVIADTNSNVLQWRDKSGCNFHFTNPSSNSVTRSPIYSTLTTNSLPSILFQSDYSTYFSHLQNTNIYISTLYDLTTFTVYQTRNNPINVGCIINCMATSAQLNFAVGNGFFINNTSGTNVNISRSSINTAIFGVSKVPNLITAVYNSSFSTTVINDIPQNFVAAGLNGVIRNTNISSFISTIGNGALQSLPFNIRFANLGSRNGPDYSQVYDGFTQEILIYNRTLSFAERQQVESYLMSKWNI